jgi:hypothetical protein
LLSQARKNEKEKNDLRRKFHSQLVYSKEQQEKEKEERERRKKKGASSTNQPKTQRTKNKKQETCVDTITVIIEHQIPLFLSLSFFLFLPSSLPPLPLLLFSFFLSSSFDILKKKENTMDLNGLVLALQQTLSESLEIRKNAEAMLTQAVSIADAFLACNFEEEGIN